MTSIAARLGNGRFSPDPFPHFIVEDVLEPQTYEGLAGAYPSLEALRGKDEAILNNYNYTHSARTIVDNPAIDERWRAFFRHHVSTEFWREIVPLIGDAIRSVHTDIEERAGRQLTEMTVAMRGMPEAQTSDIRLDCQFSINSPVRTVSTVRPAHVDQPVKIFNALLYCRLPEDKTPGGDFELYRCLRPPVFGSNGRSVLPTRIERVSSVPYRANRLVLFVNSPRAVHGVSPRPVTPHCRRYINLMCEFREPLFEARKASKWAWHGELLLHRLGRTVGAGAPAS